MAAPHQARCAEHAGAAAVDLCKRCGRFLCGECVELVGEDAYCAGCRARLPSGRSALWVAALALALLFACLAAVIVCVI